MNGKVDCTETTLIFYQTLVEMVYEEQQTLAWAKQLVRNRFQQSRIPSNILIDLMTQTCRIARQSPRRGHIGAVLVHIAAQGSNDGLIQARCELMLAETSNRLGSWSEASHLYVSAHKTFIQRGELLLAARCQLGLAMAYHHLNRNKDAIMLCEEAQQIFCQVEDLEGTAEQELLLASIYRTLGQYRQAYQWLQQAREWFTTSKLIVDIARCDVELAYIYACEQQYDNALALLHAADEIFVATASKVDAAWGRRIQAIVYLDLGEYHKVLEVLDLACAVYEAEHMRAAVRSCQRNIANAYRRLGRCNEALTIYFQLRQEFVEQGMDIDVANCDMNIALTYKEQNRYTKALAFFQKAKEACIAAGLTIHATRCQTNMASVEEILGAYDRALEEHQQARDIFAKAGMRVNVAHCEENMARIYMVTQQYDRALALLQNAYQDFLTTGSSLCVAANQILQAQAYQASGQYELAQKMLQQAQSTYVNEQMSAQKAFCLLRLAQLEQIQDRPARATALYRQARQEFCSREWSVNVALCELGLGEISLTQGQYEEALGWFIAALAVLNTDFPDWAWPVHYGLAQCYQRLAEQTKAFHHYLQAIDAIRRGRNGFYTAKGSSSFFAGRQHVYDEALAMAIQLNKAEQAVQIVEHSKAQTYLSLLYNPLGGLRSARVDNPFDDLLAQERALKGRIETLQNSLSFPGVDDAAVRSTPSYQELLKQLTIAQRDYEEIVSRLFRAHPLWTSALYPPPFSLSSFRETMLTSWPYTWGVLAYYLNNAQLTILYFDSNTVFTCSKKLTLIEEKLLRICTSPHPIQRGSVYQGIIGDHTMTNQGEGLVFLRQLYLLLIPEVVREHLSPEHLLITVPYHILHALPFHALISPGGHYLAQQSTVIYTPSLHIFQLLLKRHQVNGQQEYKRRALIIGVSEFDQRARQLSATVVEAKALHRLLGASSTLLLNHEAKCGDLFALNKIGALREYQIIHFATHALFEESAPLQSKFLLADGSLTVVDLFDFTLDAELITLSSCEGARGDLNVGDEMSGLAQAFFHAGARALVAGLWKVPDETTMVLMTQLYRALQAGQSPAQALNIAQRQMIARGYTPFHWASFVLIGHPGSFSSRYQI